MELLSTVILPYDLFFFFSLSSKPTTVCIFVFHISVRVFLIIDYLFTHAPYMDNTSVKKKVLFASESIIFAILLFI